MDVVVVESPTKAKTINKYLGNDYRVLSSYGHVRDLPEKDGSVLPDEDFRIIYEPLAQKKPRIGEIARAVKGARHLYLATDPDREGEAISWHLVAALNELGAINGVDVKRVVFHEITKRAVLEAMQHPRELDDDLIDAYQARRALDYLVGFTLSPVLWRKLQGSRSAGRVQSVALRLICEREDEIEAFRPREYWTIEGQFTTPAGAHLRRPPRAASTASGCRSSTSRARPTPRRAVGRDPGPGLRGRERREEAGAAPSGAAVRDLDAAAGGLAQARLRRRPHDAHRAAPVRGHSARGRDGRPDHLHADRQRADLARGARRLPAPDRAAATASATCPRQPRAYRTRTKNAQEAHEAIRPTELARRPEQVARFLDDDQRRLYELIWKRTMASQMASALLDRVIADLASADGQIGFRATGSTIAFDGFLKLYQEGRDDPAQDDDEAGGLLPAMAPRDPLRRGEVTPRQHFTEPPPRYTEASLVRQLEELGIGRPSTYASIISVLQDRDYVRLESKRFRPEDRGRLVSAFLVAFFDQYVQPEFTADARGPARRRRRRRAALEAGAARVLGPVLRHRRRGQGAPRRRGDRRAQRAAGAALLPAARGRRRSAPVPALRRRPAQPQARPLSVPSSAARTTPSAASPGASGSSPTRRPRASSRSA